MIETAMVPLILAQAPVTDIIGDALQPIPAPEDLAGYPCITYQTASYKADYHATGNSGWAQKRIVYNCWASSYLQAITLQEALRSALTGYSGTLSDGTQVYFIEIVNGENYFESDSRLYRATLHALIQYAE
jgi:hypothetical protein